MTDEDAFIRAIQDQPDDVTTRLVYADWLEEQVDPFRAGYLRKWAEAKGGPLTKDQYPAVELIRTAWLDLVHGRVPIWDATTTLALGRLDGILSTYAHLNMHHANIAHDFHATLRRPGRSLPELVTRHFGEVLSPVALDQLTDWQVTLRGVLDRWLFESLGSARNGPGTRLAFLSDYHRTSYIQVVLARILDVIRPRTGWQAHITGTMFYAIQWDDLILEAEDRVLFLHFSFSD
jgi:uncharacterized protein (TIGR02996 family)